MSEIKIICEDEFLKQVIKSKMNGFPLSEDEKVRDSRDVFIFCVFNNSDIEKLKNLRKRIKNLFILIVPRKSISDDLKKMADIVLEEPVDFADLSFKIKFFSAFPDLSKDQSGRFDLFFSTIDEFYSKIKRSENFSIELLQKLDKIASIRDNETHGHTQRVGELSMLVAERIGLKVEDIFKVRMTAPLHDIGKIGIPDQILFKNGPLDEEEWKIMKTHTTIGSEILDGNDDVLIFAKNIALFHHERYDGKGYPTGIKGEEIPLEARIVTVVDSFDAMVSKRPYKSEKSIQESIGELMKNAGTQFDPKIVSIFVEISDKIEMMYRTAKDFSK
ncbi:HD-GYP domain-containing protein [Athalassotoga saccharophila]|uniref:HD-GYP domain-containing protein n=1 Tax=Athalassotoga saccharophila TaxID=1441386 RepID=UPI00137A54ED|nr:HD domain-containing phosphohydrolase [Athalassotoga saccharophila]BBJ28090.1 cyclic di-GMP phosphodiesterase [Athalassotoga saccharophila]